MNVDPLQMQCFDSKTPSTIINSVYTPKIDLNYVSVLGGSQEILSTEEWAKKLEHIHSPYDSTQHVVQ